MSVTLPSEQQSKPLLRERWLSFVVTALEPEDGRARPDFEGNYADWLATVFPEAVKHPFGDHHRQFWEWVWALEPGLRPAPFVAIWARGGAKSTSAELACAAVAALGKRRYGLYVSGTQEQADDHVQNVAALLESQLLALYYPATSERMIGKFGASKGWRRNRLRTASGFTLDAVGLDTGVRGAKLEDARPDFIIIDDVDAAEDSSATIEKKLRNLTKSLIPAGASDVAILAVQNLVIPEGIFARLAGVASEPADFLADRIVSGPHPAVADLAYEERGGRYVIVAGQPTWQGQDIATCQRMLDDMGLSAFLSECQHDVEPQVGGLFGHLHFRHCEWHELPDLERIVVWVDPAISAHDGSDANGIQADGLHGKLIYRLWSWEQISTPETTLKTAIRKAVELGAEIVGIETDQGGDVWRPAYMAACEAVLAELREQAAAEALGEHLTDGGAEDDFAFDERAWDAPAMPRFRAAKAGSIGSKAHRWNLMLAGYERGEIVHVLGTHTALERALRRVPERKPYDLVDAAFWSWRDLSRPSKRFGAAGRR